MGGWIWFVSWDYGRGQSRANSPTGCRVLYGSWTHSFGSVSLIIQVGFIDVKRRDRLRIQEVQGYGGPSCRQIEVAWTFRIR
jgi:hypothetical protein